LFSPGVLVRVKDQTKTKSKSEPTDRTAPDSTGSSTPVIQQWNEGDAIEGDYKGAGTWYRGKIGRVNAYNTYDILYDDGDTERCKPAAEIRNLDNSPSTATNSRIDAPSATGIPDTVWKLKCFHSTLQNPPSNVSPFSGRRCELVTT
jgi:hypothetical protein